MAERASLPSDDRRAGFRVISSEDAPGYDTGAQAWTDPFVMLSWALMERLAGDGDGQLVLLALARFANQDGECWPSIAALCKQTGRSDRQVRYTLNRLVEAEIIAKKPRNVGGMKSVNVYRIVRKSPEVKTGTTCRTSGTTCRTVRHHMPDRPAPHADRTRTSELEPREQEEIPPVVPQPAESKKERAQATALPDPFAPSLEMRRAAKTRYGLTDAQIDAKTERFKSWALAKGQKYIRWDQAWLNWMEPKAWDAPANGASNGRRPSVAEQNAVVFARLQAKLDAERHGGEVIDAGFVVERER